MNDLSLTDSKLRIIKRQVTTPLTRSTAILIFWICATFVVWDFNPELTYKEIITGYWYSTFAIAYVMATINSMWRELTYAHTLKVYEDKGEV